MPGRESTPHVAGTGAPTGSPTDRPGLRRTFAALRHPNYRLWFFGQLISVFGTWMQITAQGFLVYELTGSAAYLGYLGFARGLPSWLLMLYGGVVADRVPRRSLLLVTQSLLSVLALVLAGLVWSGVVEAWHILVLAACSGCVVAFDAPARQAFVKEMVDRHDLTNAIALNSTLFNSAATFGPAVAGITYALVGPVLCFALNGLSFLGLIVALVRMRLPDLPARERRPALRELGEGLRFVAGHETIRTLLLGLAFTSLCGLGMMTLLPAFAVRVFEGDATTNGWLYSARGLGSLSGALLIASLGQFQGRGRLLDVARFVLPLLMLAFSRLDQLPLALGALVGFGWGIMVVFNLTNSLVQSHVPDHLRGRVMGLYTLTLFGLMPLGALLAGTLATRLGEPSTALLLGSALLGFAALVRIACPRLRRLE